MRIRKRFPASSSVSSAALSDPQLNRSPVVQPHIQVNPHENLHVVQEEAKHNKSKSPDPQNQPLEQARSQVITIRSENPRWDSLHNGTDEDDKLKQKEIEGKEIKEESCKCNHTRKESVQEELMTTQFPQPSSSSSPVLERWCEGDKVVPLKKRKASFDTIIASKEILRAAKMKSKTNKKCLQGNDDDQEGIKNTASASVKKSKRGSVIMEGSRCSRVNGRGWRCCQQTLVGYSLCEHHLGKGRLRSMTSVRNRAMANQIGANDQKDETVAPLSRLLEKEEMKTVSRMNKDDDDDEKKPVVEVAKKRMKLGAVKARSMSSLLGQTNNAVVAASSTKYSG